MCVFDRLFFRKDRALEVEGNDLRALSTSLILAGPQPESLAAIRRRPTHASAVSLDAHRADVPTRDPKVLPLTVPKKKASKDAARTAANAAEPT